MILKLSVFAQFSVYSGINTSARHWVCSCVLLCSCKLINKILLLTLLHCMTPPNCTRVYYQTPSDVFITWPFLLLSTNIKKLKRLYTALVLLLATAGRYWYLCFYVSFPFSFDYILFVSIPFSLSVSLFNIFCTLDLHV